MGGAKDVFAEGFTTDGVVGAGRGCGMQREAVQGGAEPLGILELTAWAEPDGVSLAQGGTGGDTAQGGGHGELGERRLGVSERLVSVDRVVLDDALAAGRDLQDVCDVAVGQAR